MAIIIHDISEELLLQSDNVYSLNKLNQRDCCGCFSCWLTTPGKCIYNDSDELLKNYLLADKVVIIAKLKHGFISGRLKTFFDRLLPLYLPHSKPEENGYNHIPRYDKYPDIVFYYFDDFQHTGEQKVLEGYINRTFKQFRSKDISIKKITKLSEVKLNNENTHN